MSKGEIVSDLGRGKYRVRQLLAVESVKKEIDALTEKLAALAIKIPQKKLELLTAERAAQDKADEIEAKIPDLISGVDGARQDITKLQVELAPLQYAAADLKLKVSRLVAEDLANRKRQAQLQAIPEGREIDAWCADYSPDMSGEVGLIDINDEGGKGVLVHPGHLGAAEYAAPRDGALFPNLAQSAAQIFYNAAMLPGVQKWMPKYRIGTITHLTIDSASVELDPAQSSAQGLPINQTATLTDVPVVYMDCNSSAFEEGDRVLVRFTKDGPLVVGFESNPKACTAKIICTPMRSTWIWEADYFGVPFEGEGGGEINAPLGSPDSPATGAWIFTKLPSTYLRGAPQNYGLRNWIGANPSDVVSWHAPPSRICGLGQEFEGTMWRLYSSWHPAFGSEIFHKGVEICDLRKLNISADFRTVDGAAIVYSPDKKQRWLRVCASNLAVGVYGQWQTDDDRYSCYIIDIPWPGVKPDTEDFEIIATHSTNFLIPASQGMYFSASGDKAVMCFSRETHSVLALHWEEAGGFTEDPIWQFDDGSSGTVIITKGGSFSEYTGTEDYQSFRSAGHEEILGYDFDGDQLKPVKRVFGELEYASSSRTTRNNPLQEVYYTYGGSGPGLYPVYVHKVTSIVSSSSQSSRSEPVRLFFGDTLLVEPDRGTQYRYSGGFTESGGDYVGYISGAGSGDYHGDAFNNASLVIDPRFGLVACEYSSTDGTEQAVGDGAARTDTSTYTTTTSYRLYRNNEVLHEIVTEPVVDHKSTTITPDPFGNNVNSWDHETPEVEHEYINSPWSRTRSTIDTFRINDLNSALNKGVRIQQASVVGNGSQVAASVEWFHDTGNNTYELYRFTYMDGAEEPVKTVMKRDPADGYMFGNFGLM